MMWRWPGGCALDVQLWRGKGRPRQREEHGEVEGAGRAPGMGREAGPGRRGLLMPAHFGAWGPLCGSRAVVQETPRPESVLRLWFGDSGIYVTLGKLPVKALPESIPFLLYSARKTRS